MCSVKKKVVYFQQYFLLVCALLLRARTRSFPSVLSNDDFACHITGLGGVEWLCSKPTAASSLTYEKYDLSSRAQSLSQTCPELLKIWRLLLWDRRLKKYTFYFLGADGFISAYLCAGQSTRDPREGGSCLSRRHTTAFLNIPFRSAKSDR